MELILLPLTRFLFGGLSMASGRTSRLFAVLALVADAALLARLIFGLVEGSPSLLVLGGWGQGLGIAFVGDRIALTFASLTWGLGVAVVLYTWKDSLRPYFFMLLHLLIGASYAMALTRDLFNAYVILELLTLASFLLVGYERRPRQIWASLRYLVLCSLGMSLFLLGIAVVYYHTQTLDLATLAARIATDPSAPWVRLAAALLVGGVTVKAGVFVFSLWLPAAHARAMPAVSALLSGVVIKMGIVALFRLSQVFPLSLTFTVLGFTTAFLGILYAIQTHDAKRLLAFSTLSQIGYLLIGFGAGTEAARIGALNYAVAHGLFKALLFLAVGEAARIVGGSDVRMLVSSRRLIPGATRAALIVGVLGIVGIPPLAGFTAKTILESSIHPTLLHAAVGLISVGTAAAFAKLIPLLVGRSSGHIEWNRALAFAWLGGAVVLFLPLSVFVVPRSLLSATWHWPAYVEAGSAILIGVILHRFLRKRRFRLPQSIFRIEEGTLVILAGFLLIYALLSVA
ncbi:MAG: proton-conducting transporter membrane subunit [Candidatus Bipolaricaulia bacterium]